MPSPNPFQTLVSYILPKELFEYFELVTVSELNGELHIYLDEGLLPPTSHESWEVRPNGFLPEVQIRDFPIRDHKVFLHVRRRRWLEISTNETVIRRWSLTAEGTRYTEEFASFLKELLGFIPDYGPLS